MIKRVGVLAALIGVVAFAYRAVRNLLGGSDGEDIEA